MITKNVEGKYELDIFLKFQIDHSLPKFQKVKQSEYYTATATTNTLVFTSAVSGSWNQDQGKPKTPSLFSRLLDKLITKKIELGKVPVIKIFEKIGASFYQLEQLQDRIAVHDNAISYASSMGQIALRDDLIKKKESVKHEDALYVLGQKEYIEEAVLIEFAMSCEKGLRLDWIKNFTRLIPKAGCDLKLKMDSHAIFDNYVILHYDPQGKATKLTDSERKKKEDPILFGVISGSRRLYHIYSWKDELCDLTFDQIVSKYPDKIKQIEDLHLAKI